MKSEQLLKFLGRFATIITKKVKKFVGDESTKLPATHYIHKPHSREAFQMMKKKYSSSPATMSAIRAKTPIDPADAEFGDYDSDDSVADDLEGTFGVLKIQDLEEEKLTDSDRDIISQMTELKNHSWKPVDSLVVSLGKNTNRMSAIKGSRSNRLKSKREVSFNVVIVREYGMTLGDNPSCSYGPPVQLDWDYEESKNLKLEEYERTRSTRRSMRQMVLSYYRRCDILKSAGYTMHEMKRVTRQANKVKRQRDTTKFFMPVMSVEAAVRSAGRKVKRVAGSAKKE